MSGRITALVAVSLAAAILELLLPSEDERGTRMLLRFMTALITLLLIAAPLLPLLSESDTLWKGEIEWESDEQLQERLEAELQYAVSAQSAEQLEDWCCKMLQERYGLTAQQVTVRAGLDDSGTLTRLSVRLSGAGLLRDPEEIADTLRSYFDCEVEVR